MKVLQRSEAISLIKKSNGKIFTACFRKRTDNKMRIMNCRLGVTKGIKGTGNNIDKVKHELLTVYDMQAKAFRSIPIPNIVNLTIDGQMYLVD